MTAIAFASPYIGPPVVLEQSSPASRTGQELSMLVGKAVEHARSNASDWRPLTSALIEEVAAECRSSNWDGYGAQPIREAAKEQAQRFVDLLPARFRGPDPVADPDGNIALSWDFGPGRVLTIDIGADGKLTYAALLGAGVKRHGVEQLNGHIPKVILETIDELHERSGAAG